ncbi:NTP transferase domain-containing protein [Paenibacillus sp. IB182496]|uniref:NTP transferase domain-containing protein n=1 Tax=Paenibacillus sabuli TaxID=2772509 RepID=A0A927BNW0_9BACL|nr:sugar phosphate nucleotidyltransferase [Paenibacillus sabuli]MBD2844003.1 NTP transferase domain-containing protein [Paenibacillus sabuli]
MKKAVLLAAGEGQKMWPYGAIRPKALLPVGARPLIAWQLELLLELGMEQIIVVTGHKGEQIGHWLQHASGLSETERQRIALVSAGAAAAPLPPGTARSLLAAADLLRGETSFLVLYADIWVERHDLARLLAQPLRDRTGSEAAAALAVPLGSERQSDWICCRLEAAERSAPDSPGGADGGTGQWIDRGDDAHIGSTTDEWAGIHREERTTASKGPASPSRGPSVTPAARIAAICGHPRDGYTHRCGGAYALPQRFLSYCAASSGRFTAVQVGMMPPEASELEQALADWLADGRELAAVETQRPCYDLDKPWHILQASARAVSASCAELGGHELAEGASIDPSAQIGGYVRLGRNSRIGRHVTIKGSAIVGDDTVIEDGALLLGDHRIGSRTHLANTCLLAPGASVGNGCVVNHCAELDGLLMDGVYLYHYMEVYGIVGTGADLGAATVCGSLRFDDGQTTHRIRGRREWPQAWGDAVFIGDYARTGVNAILMPGVKTGVYSIVGPGVVLERDLPDRTLVRVQQELKYQPWGPERYGW